MFEFVYNKIILKKMTRANFKVIGVFSMVIGVFVVIYAAFVLQSSTFEIEYWDSDQPMSHSGETPYQQYLVGLFGVIMIFLGFRSYRFIPYSERDMRNVSEYDLDTDKS